MGSESDYFSLGSHSIVRVSDTHARPSDTHDQPSRTWTTAGRPRPLRAARDRDTDVPVSGRRTGGRQLREASVVRAGVYAHAMARGGGSTEAGIIYHVISRFVAKEWFIESAIERRTYLGLLGTAIATTNWLCFSYAVMSSHIHLGLIAGTDTMASWMRPMHTLFANWLNLRRERIGAVFVKGPNVITVPPSDCARLINYHHNNPVRAGLVARPAESDWTSHRAYIGAASKPRWLDVSAGLALGDFADHEDFARWCDDVRVTRRDLVGVLPRRRGRPSAGTARHLGADPEKGETRLSRRRVSS